MTDPRWPLGAFVQKKANSKWRDEGMPNHADAIERGEHLT